ncbi:Alanine racemase [Waddlia chondrophila 2032/99]|uniref:Alanine racemase n=1 Tax=Waddlia chondrophila 2032/99 TaxID=765953 RepID=F8LC80_9BACT|nr:Alanine racemase [Waddlia chondrophila 2032/99]
MDAFDLRNWSGFISAGGDSNRPALIDQIVIDTRRIYASNALFAALKGQRQDGHSFVSGSGAKFALVEKHWEGPADGPFLLKVDDPLTAFQEIAGSYRSQLRGNVIAVIGSYGKTMVKDLLRHLLSSSFTVASSPESFNSQVGVPLSLLGAVKAHEQVIIEAGFSHPGEMARLCKIIRPSHIILTHVGNKHLHTIGSKEQIAQEMCHFSLSSDAAWTLLPKDPILSPLPNPYYWDTPQPNLPHASFHENSKAITVQFPKGDAHTILRPLGMSYILDLINIGLKAAYLLGVPEKQIVDALKTYQPEPMSTEIWKSQNGATFINETYCEDPQSLDCALRRFDFHSPKGKKTLLFSGIKQNDPALDARIGEAIGNSMPDTLMLIEPSFQLEHAVKTIAPQTAIRHFSTVEAALKDHAGSMRSEDILIVKGKKKLPFDQLTQTVQGSIFSNQCRINLAAIASNIKQIRSRLTPHTEIMAMVKATAYGTQDALMAKFLKTEGIRRLGVSYIDEGISLRKEGVDQDIFVLNAAPYEIEKAVSWQFEIAVNDKETIDQIGRMSSERGTITRVHLHINTGMSRLGCRPEEALPLARIIQAHPHLKLEGVMTHFACSDDPDEDTFTLEQSRIFDHSIEAIEQEGISIPFRHACNSAAALRLHFPQYNIVRIGMALYGLCPGGTLALSLHSRIVGINHCIKGETISYGRSYTVQREREKIAVIPIGYYDGLHLNYSSKGEVMIHGAKAPIVGRICMDYMMVDITHIPDACIGDPVLIFGEDAEGNVLSPNELAEQGNSSVYELISCLGPRIQRVFIHEENDKIM